MRPPTNVMKLIHPVKTPVEQWPVRQFEPGHEPHFLFILTPPYSGSTALAQVLNTSYRTMFLEPRGEGARLIPGLSEKDRWEPTKYVNYESVRSVWLHQFQYVHSLVHTVDVVIEKSPPNMMRIEKLAALFQKRSFIANIRNPYANCVSILYRTRDVETLSPGQRRDALTKVANKWLAISRQLRDLMNRFDIPLLTYETFCASPPAALQNVGLPDGMLETIDTKALLKIKDYSPQPLSNQNARQIARLTGDDIESISRVLRQDEPLLDFFGYQELKVEG
jgi:hypothetical protein